MSEPGGNFESVLEAILRRVIREELRGLLQNDRTLPHGENGGKYLTVKQAAEVSRLAPSTIRLAIRKRELRSLKVGSRVIIKREDLEQFLEANPICALPE
jgi:excisionase family DNA binding protein